MMACAWTSIGGCSPVDWAQIVGGVSATVASVAALVAIPIALVQLAESRRLHAIQMFVLSSEKVAELTREVRTLLIGMPGSKVDLHRISAVFAAIDGQITIIVRCRSEAADFIDVWSLENVAYQVSSSTDPLCRLVDGVATGIGPTVLDSWSPEFCRNVIFWANGLKRQLLLLSESTVAQGAIRMLDASFSRLPQELRPP